MTLLLGLSNTLRALEVVLASYESLTLVEQEQVPQCSLQIAIFASQAGGNQIESIVQQVAIDN